MPQHKTLIFHIGDHKTGSTSIQLAFAAKRVSFEGKSVFYPAKLAMNALGARCKAWVQASTPEERKRAARPLKKLAQTVQKSDADYVLISAEAFELVPAEVLHEVVETFFRETADDIRIFGYVRPHAPRLLSSFCERTKVGAPRVLDATLEQFVSQKSRDQEFIYLPRFTAWLEHFGEAFTLRPMIRAQLHNGSVVEDFLYHAFDGIPYQVSPGSSANESLDLVDLMRLKVLHSALRHESHDLRLKVGWEFSRLISHMPPPSAPQKLRLHHSVAKKIAATYRDDARAMDKTFFGGAPFLEDQLQSALIQAQGYDAQSVDPKDYLSTAELRTLTVMSNFMAGLLEKKEVNWEAHLHQKRVDDVRSDKASEKRSSRKIFPTVN